MIKPAMKPQFLLLSVLPVFLLAPGTRAEVTSRSYVQKGLVACYDGIDNAGTGVHDSTAATWADLSGNEFDGTLAANLGWAADGWTNAVDGSGVQVGTRLADALSLGAFTVQFACVPARDNVRQAFFSDYANQNGTIAVEHNDGDTSAGRLRLFRDGNPRYSVLSPVVIPKDAFSSVSVSATQTEQAYWRNGAEAWTNDAVFAAAAAGFPSVIGGDTYRANMAFRGVYHAFRAYNRALPEAEVKVNAAIDAIRFDGADPADFTLGGGYSFDADGDLCVTVSATAGEVDGEPGGTVSAGGGAAGVSASQTSKQYGTVALEATPAAGLLFVRWSGDTDAITTGLQTDASIVVTAHSSLDLVAVFRAAGGGDDAGDGSALTSRSYVRRGLVAHFDGIDNAGFGLHDGATNVWTDLTGNGNDGAVAAIVSWTSNGWENASDGKPVTLPSGTVSETLGSGAFTMQIACNPTRDTARECFFGQYAQPGGFSLEHNNGSTSAGRVRFYCAWGGDYLSPAVVPRNVLTSLSCSLTPSTQIAWAGFETVYTNTTTFVPPSTDCSSVLGGEFHRSEMAFRGTYHAFRLYDRVLTEAEVKANAAVDAIRFGGASPSDFTLAGGFSFDATDGLRATVAAAATAADGTGGSVAANGGATGESASASVAIGATVSLVATPAAGYVFDHWDGDTDLLAAGCSVRDAAVSVEALTCARLVAVFRHRTVGLNAYSCVRRGLVAHFDGVDNAGTGTHDPAATTWADLTGNGNTGTLAANVTWAANGWVNDANCYPVSLSAGTISPVTASKTFTAQFAATPSRGNVRECFFGQYNAPGITIEHNSGGVSDGRIRLYYNLGSAVSQEYADITVVAGEWASITATSKPGEQTVWKNGSQSQSMANALSGTLTAECNSTIGCDLARTTMAFRGTYNVFRLYDRVLTEDEIKVNAAVDAVRFGGKTTAQVSPLPDGWSFAADDTLMVTLSATADKGGRVRVNGGPADRSVSTTVNQDGLDVVAFAAEPIAGYAFDHWEGDTDWIEFGSAETAEIVVDSTGPASLVATFVKLYEPPTVILVK